MADSSQSSSRQSRASSTTAQTTKSVSSSQLGVSKGERSKRPIKMNFRKVLIQPNERQDDEAIFRSEVHEFLRRYLDDDMIHVVLRSLLQAGAPYELKTMLVSAEYMRPSELSALDSILGSGWKCFLNDCLQIAMFLCYKFCDVHLELASNAQLQLTSNEAYSTNCPPSHVIDFRNFASCPLLVSSVHVGTMQQPMASHERHTFLRAYSVFNAEGKQLPNYYRRVRLSFLVRDQGLGASIASKYVAVEFKHTRKVLAIYFLHEKKAYKIEMTYDQIRRVTADLHEEPDEGLALYFHFNVPIQLWRYVERDPDKARLQQEDVRAATLNDWTRCLIIPPFCNQSCGADLSESPPSTSAKSDSSLLAALTNENGTMACPCARTFAQHQTLCLRLERFSEELFNAFARRLPRSGGLHQAPINTNLECFPLSKYFTRTSSSSGAKTGGYDAYKEECCCLQKRPCLPSNIVLEIVSRLRWLSKVRNNIWFCRVVTAPMPPVDTTPWEKLIKKQRTTFRAAYALKGLLERGIPACGSTLWDTAGAMLEFIRDVNDKLDPKKSTPVLAEVALEHLLNAVDENRCMQLLHAFNSIYDSLKERRAAGEDIDAVRSYNEHDFIRVRKVIVTPTRVLLYPAEPIIGNRVLRSYNPEYALRLIFKNDDLRESNFRSAFVQGCNSAPGFDGTGIKSEWFAITRNMVVKTLDLTTAEQANGVVASPSGITIRDRHYQFLAWSNSQMRTHGCYMYCDNEKYTRQRILQDIGIHGSGLSVPKYMSYCGLSFTQAQKSIKLPLANFEVEDDICSAPVQVQVDEGGVSKTVTVTYIFSDGIGRISKKTAEVICASHRPPISPLRSAYQVRFMGCIKGMLSIDPLLSDAPADDGKWKPRVIFRRSMQKFQPPDIEMKKSEHFLEVVKYSQPSQVFLNRPLIMILDQVSKKQAPHLNRNVCKRAHELLDGELFRLADMLMHEATATRELSERTNSGICFQRLHNANFILTREPFFRSMLIAIHRCTIKTKLVKMKLPVDMKVGRTMFGVLDDTGLLNYGQVFVQYSQNPSHVGISKVIKTGKVMVTKNPCLVPGDVRLFEAVDIEALHHMYDVIVFPRHGKRPHPDEMAGSDLDG